MGCLVCAQYTVVSGKDDRARFKGMVEVERVEIFGSG